VELKGNGMASELTQLLDLIGREKGLDKTALVEAIETAVLSAAKKRMGRENLTAAFDPESGEVEVFLLKRTVEEVSDPNEEIDLPEARKRYPSVQPGEIVRVPCEIRDLGRIAAQSAKQIIHQKVRQVERDHIFTDFQSKKGELVTGRVLRKEYGDLIVDLGQTEGILPKQEQCLREGFQRGDHVRCYVFDVRMTSRGPKVMLSRTHPGLLVKLFEMEVPEAAEGVVEIKAAARDGSGRSKIAVFSKEKSIDPVGACVGMKGVRVQSVIAELGGEKIDVVPWSEDPKTFIENALAPAKITRIVMDPAENRARVIVPDDQLSLAIGKKGVNVRLAVKLTKWDIDVVSESEYSEKNFSDGREKKQLTN
jgi:N utilization substance protein A